MTLISGLYLLSFDFLFNIKIQYNKMSFPFSLYPSLDQLRNPLLPFYYFTHQHLQPTTVIVSNSSSPSLECQKQTENKNFPSTQSSISSRSASPPAKLEQRKENKQIKKVLPKKKDENFGFRNQNKDRNMLSSILKGYVQFILHNRGMIKMIQQLAKKLGLQNGVSGFYEYMARTFPAKKSYIGVQYMQNTLKSQNETPQMTHILGVTLRHYLQEVYLINLYQGSKLKKKMRLTLIKKARQITSLLFSQ